MVYKFSPSKLNLVKDCPRCFWLEFNKKFRRPRGIFPSLPSGMDKILKNHFDEYTKKKEMPPELKELKGYELFPDLELLETWRSMYKGIIHKTDKFIIKGCVDALLKKGDKLVVLDYKTRGYPLKEDTHEHYIEQQALYNYLLRKNDYETEDYSYLLFYHPDKVVDNVFLFHADLVKIDTNIKIAEDIIDKAIKIIEGPIPKLNQKCEYCKYLNTKPDLTESKEKIKKSTLLDY